MTAHGLFSAFAGSLLLASVTCVHSAAGQSLPRYNDSWDLQAAGSLPDAEAADAKEGAEVDPDAPDSNTEAAPNSQIWGTGAAYSKHWQDSLVGRKTFGPSGGASEQGGGSDARAPDSTYGARSGYGGGSRYGGSTNYGASRSDSWSYTRQLYGGSQRRY